MYNITPLKVLQSAYGFYIGREYCVNVNEFQPYSRNSEYFETKEQAECVLYDSNQFDIYSDD